MLRKMLKYRLPIEENKKLLKFAKENYPYHEIHHITKGFKGCKHSDYLLAYVTREEHDQIHRQGMEDFDELILRNFEILIKYIKYLEDKN